MSLEGPWAQTLASPLLGGTHKFSLCPHSQLIGMCLLRAPPSVLHSSSTSWHTRTSGVTPSWILTQFATP